MDRWLVYWRMSYFSDSIRNEYKCTMDPNKILIYGMYEKKLTLQIDWNRYDNKCLVIALTYVITPTLFGGDLGWMYMLRNVSLCSPYSTMGGLNPEQAVMTTKPIWPKKTPKTPPSSFRKSSKYLLSLSLKKGHFLPLMAICTGQGKRGSGVISAQLSALLA